VFARASASKECASRYNWQNLLVKDDVISKIKKLNYIGTLEILPVLLEINEEILFLVVVYRPNGPIGTFVNTLINTR
jgi:cellobiose-specific phosphotransferase system component IIC